jgi:hypothetical protein
MIFLYTNSVFGQCQVYDDFSGSTIDFGIWNIVTGSWWIQNERLMGYWDLSSAQTDQGNILLVDSLQPSGDYTVEVDAIVSEVDQHKNNHKLVLYNSPGNKYNIDFVSDAKVFDVGYRSGGSTWQTLVWIDSVPYFNRTPGEINHAKLVRTGDHFKFFLNGYFIYEFDEILFGGAVKIGLGCYGNITYDNFCLSTPPNSFSLFSPLNDDSVKTSVTLKWQTSIDPDSTDTVHYDLYLSRSVVFNPDSTDTIYSLLDTTFTDNLDLKTWFWKVKAYDRWGVVRWSDQTWSFYAYLCGDDNGDGKITVSDVVYEINFLFKGGPAPVPYKAGDVNCDGKETVSDVVYKINYLFKGGPKPCKDCP